MSGDRQNSGAGSSGVSTACFCGAESDLSATACHYRVCPAGMSATGCGRAITRISERIY